MIAALADAGISPSDVGYVNAHGTSTEANDATEEKTRRESLAAHPLVPSLLRVPAGGSAWVTFEIHR